MNKKILYVVPGFPVGGAEKFLIMLANSCVHHTEWQTVISLSDNNKLQHEFDPSIRFLPLPRSGKFKTSAAGKLRKYVLENKPDIIFCLNFFSYFFTRFAIFGIRDKIPVYISYQTTIHLNKKEHLLHKLYFSVLRHRDKILFTSRNQEAFTVKQYGIPRKYYHTIINGIELNRWHLPENCQTRAQIREKYDIPEDARVIIMTAAFRAEKNHSGAVRALKLLQQKYQQPAYLLFVGDGHLIGHTRQYVEEQGMKDFVRFAGPQKDVRPFYWASDLFTLCSTAVETFSFAALEAMACGLPLVLTDIGGANEMIAEGLNGYLCQVTDEDIARQWNKALQTGFSKQRINQYAEAHFNADRMTKEYRQYLKLTPEVE